MKTPINDVPDQERIAQIAHHEIVCGALREGISLEIDAANPEAFFLQATHQMSTNEASGSEYQGCISFLHESFHCDKRDRATRAKNTSLRSADPE
jgi:hypothetical protein